MSSCFLVDPLDESTGPSLGIGLTMFAPICLDNGFGELTLCRLVMTYLSDSYEAPH